MTRDPAATFSGHTADIPADAEAGAWGDEGRAGGVGGV